MDFGHIHMDWCEFLSLKPVIMIVLFKLSRQYSAKNTVDRSDVNRIF